VDYPLYQLRVDSGLLRDGWFRSMDEKQPVDLEGNPIPWLTYPAIKFLARMVSANHKVFEYGSGNSTLWWASRVSSVYSCEHDKVWYDIGKERIPGNVSLIYKELEYNGDYCREIEKYNNEFNFIIIDGRDRVNCIKNSLRALKENGILILDDSERERYKEAIDFLLEKGFKGIDFEGMSPSITFARHTTIFYQKDGLLKL
jgi:hypothetical protein